MDLIKLLDLANPKKVKDTINTLLIEYSSFTEQNTTATNIAIATANTAITTANKALDNSNAALSDSSAALSYAEQAFQNSQDAVNTAIDAKETVDEAYDFATDAFTNSEEAIGYADQAYDNANEAMRIAETADALAVLARQDSLNAVSVSENANNIATTAVNTANSAYTKADTALTNSSTALITANSANTKADTAIQNAQTAVTKADTALTTSNTANTSAANAVITANSALEIINAAYAKSEEAVNTANSAKEIAEGIDGKATQALANSVAAMTESTEAKSIAQEALDSAVSGSGTKVTVDGVPQNTWESNTKADVSALENYTLREDLKEYSFGITGDGYWKVNEDGTMSTVSGTITAKYNPLTGKSGFTSYTLVRSNNMSAFVTGHNNLHTKISNLESAVNQAIEDVSGDIEKFYKNDDILAQAITDVAGTIPTKVSDLDNDAGFITQDALPTDYVTTNTSQTITASKKFNGYVYLGSSITMLGDANGTITVGKNNDANCTPTIKMRSNATGNDYDVMVTASNGGEEVGQGTLEITSGKITHNGVEVATKNDIPTNVSELNNDSGFITKSGFSMRASSTPLKFYYNEGDGETAVQLNAPDIPKHTLSLVPSGTQIPKDGNLDLNSIDYIKVGLYYCSADATVQTLSNRPTDRAFMMEVYTPLSTAVDNETTSAWVYRIRKLMTYTGDQYIQSVSSGATAGTFTYGAWSRIAKASEIPTDYVKTTGTQTIGGLKTFSYDLNIGTSLKLLSSSNGGIEIGRTDGTTSTPYIDFHTDGATTDYNVRLIASGGTAGTTGNGTLNISAGAVTINGKEVALKESLNTKANLSGNNTFNGHQYVKGGINVDTDITLGQNATPGTNRYLNFYDSSSSNFVSRMWQNGNSLYISTPDTVYINDVNILNKMSKYDYRSSWVSMGKKSTTTFTHNLGTKNIMIMLEVTNSITNGTATGTQIFQLFGQPDGTGNSYGNFAYDTARDNNYIQVSTGNQYFVRREAGSSTISWDSGYVRATIWKLN